MIGAIQNCPEIFVEEFAFINCGRTPEERDAMFPKRLNIKWNNCERNFCFCTRGKNQEKSKWRKTNILYFYLNIFNYNCRHSVEYIQQNASLWNWSSIKKRDSWFKCTRVDCQLNNQFYDACVRNKPDIWIVMSSLLSSLIFISKYILKIICFLFLYQYFHQIQSLDFSI